MSAISRSCTIEFADHMLSNDGIAISELVKIANEDAGKIAYSFGKSKCFINVYIGMIC